MQFSNVADPFDLPPDTPPQLDALMAQYRRRNHVTVLALGPKLPQPLTFEALKADIAETASLRGFEVLQILEKASTAAELAARLWVPVPIDDTMQEPSAAFYRHPVSQYLEALRFNVSTIQQ
jgi:hypothetical protein